MSTPIACCAGLPPAAFKTASRAHPVPFASHTLYQLLHNGQVAPRWTPRADRAVGRRAVEEASIYHRLHCVHLLWGEGLRVWDFGSGFVVQGSGFTVWV